MHIMAVYLNEHFFETVAKKIKRDQINACISVSKKFQYLQYNVMDDVSNYRSQLGLEI